MNTRGTMNLDSMRSANAAREAEEQREVLLKKSAMVPIRDHLQVSHSFSLYITVVCFPVLLRFAFVVHLF